MQGLRVVATLLALFIGFATAARIDCGPPLKNSFESQAGGFVFSWQHVDPITVEIQFQLAGTAFIGIGPGSIGMKGADIILGWVNDDGSYYIGDFYAQDKTTGPQLDTAYGGRNDVVPVCGVRKDGVTVLRFRRALVTGDAYDLPLVNGTNAFIYAWGDGKPGDIHYHGPSNHNLVKIDLLRPDGVPLDDYGRDETGYNARLFVRDAIAGTLSTIQSGTPGRIDPSMNGHPYGSVAGIADENPSTGRPILLLSELERNIINWHADKRVALSIFTPLDKLGDTDVMAAPRVTLLGTLVPVTGAERDAARKAYLAKHPKAVWIDFGDFSLYRMNITDIYWVGGFGGAHYIGWIKPEQYLSHKI